jgi:hypothetical protein
VPYISPHRRTQAVHDDPANVGELTWVLYTTLLSYLGGARSFAKYSEVVGALECAKHELYRTQIAGYEDLKRLENGDVF